MRCSDPAPCSPSGNAEEAFTEALQEGGISQKEQALLERLRDSLGISASDAVAIEAELQARQDSGAIPGGANAG